MPHGFLSPSRPRCRNAGDAAPYDYYAGTCQPRRVRALFLRADRVVRPYGGASGTPPFIQNTRRLSRRVSDCQKTCPVTSIGGKDSVKGNRQGSLSRSITRRSDQKRKIKYCFLFCDFAAACQKSPFGLF